jgi:hypothetical protein
MPDPGVRLDPADHHPELRAIRAGLDARDWPAARRHRPRTGRPGPLGGPADLGPGPPTGPRRDPPPVRQARRDRPAPPARPAVPAAEALPEVGRQLGTAAPLVSGGHAGRAARRAAGWSGRRRAHRALGGARGGWAGLSVQRTGPRRAVRGGEPFDLACRLPSGARLGGRGQQLRDGLRSAPRPARCGTCRGPRGHPERGVPGGVRGLGDRPVDGAGERGRPPRFRSRGPGRRRGRPGPARPSCASSRTWSSGWRRRSSAA